MNAQLIRQDNLTVQQQMMKVSDLATVAHAQMDTKLEEVVACVTRTGLGNSKQNGWDLHVKQAGVESFLLPLLLMKDPLQEVLSTLISDEEQGDLESGHWSSIWSEFNALLASSHQAAAHLAKDQSLVPFGQRVVPGLNHESRRGRQEHQRRERGTRLLNWRDDRQVLTAPFKRLCNTRNLHRATSQGLLVLDLESPPSEAIYQDTSSTLLFFPNEGICKTGIIAGLAMPVRNSRQLRTYRKVYETEDTEDTRLEIWAAVDDEHDFVVITRAPFKKSFTSCYIGRLTDLPSHRDLWRYIDRLKSFDGLRESTIECISIRCLVLVAITHIIRHSRTEG